MRILKYIFLLLLLSIVALTIFIATQKGKFVVERSYIVKAPRNTVYQFVKDLRNWQDFAIWIPSDNATPLSFSKNSIGNAATLSWDGETSSGSIKILSSQENDSIVQKINFDGTETATITRFKDTLYGTKVTLKSEGTMSFTMKVTSALQGGIDKIMGRIYEKSLEKLEKILIFEINNFTVNGTVLRTKSGTNYLKQTFTSKLNNVYKNATIVLHKIGAFCDKNSIETNGKPFLIFHTYDAATELATISFCVPTKERILTSSGSDILSGTLEPFEAIKTTLKGNYSNISKALKQSDAYIIKNKVVVNPIFSHLEVFTINNNEEKSPSKWETDIYVPLLPKVVPITVPARPRAVIPEVINKQPAEEESKENNTEF